MIVVELEMYKLNGKIQNGSRAPYFQSKILITGFDSMIDFILKILQNRDKSLHSV